MRKYIIGAIFGIILTLSVSTYAEEIETGVKRMDGKVVSGSFPVSVNGEKLKESAIIIDNKGYLPTREFAEALGAEVTFDQDAGISISSRRSQARDRLIPVENEEETRRRTLVKLTRQIESYKANIRTVEVNIITLEKSRPEKVDEINMLKAGLEKFRSELADLERQKAELESSQ